MTLRLLASNLRQVVHYHGLAAGAQMLGLAALRRKLCLERVFFFEMVRVPPQPWKTDARYTRWAEPSDIVTMAEEPVWNMSDLGSGDVESLFSAGHRCVLNVVEGQIAGYAWVNPNRIVVPKLRTAIALGPREVHVYKGMTHPAFRGRRVGVDRFAHWLTQLDGMTVLVDFAFDNPATLARAERSGLQEVGSGTYLRRGHFERRWITGRLADRPREAVHYDIAHRDH